MILTFTLQGQIVPKARPRVTYKGAFMPQKYREWMEDAAADLLAQKLMMGISEPLPSPVGLAIALKGKHSKRGDLDNISGSIMDALVKVQILKNDNLNNINSLKIDGSRIGKEAPLTEINLTFEAVGRGDR